MSNQFEDTPIIAPINKKARKTKKQFAQELDKFVELYSEGLSQLEIMRDMAISPSQYKNLLLQALLIRAMEVKEPEYETITLTNCHQKIALHFSGDKNALVKIIPRGDNHVELLLA